MVRLGSGAERGVKDYKLTRYACYLIAMNGDPKKREIAFAQSYFALKTRERELIERRVLPAHAGMIPSSSSSMSAMASGSRRSGLPERASAPGSTATSSGGYMPRRGRAGCASSRSARLGMAMA